MSSYGTLNGETRLIAIIGNPIAQVQSPSGVTKTLQENERNAIVIPIDVMPNDLDRFIGGASLAKNIDGMIVTIPHKFATYRHCATVTDRSLFLESVNMIRRNQDGTWHGDTVDGVGMVVGIRNNGGDPKGKHTLLVGAGGAGSAIALALLDNGVSDLAIHDVNHARRDELVSRLQNKFGDKIYIGSSDPTGYDLVVNATPMGMKPEDPFPVQVDKIASGTFAACVINSPSVSPWIEAARLHNCKTSVGADMFKGALAAMVNFFLEVLK